MHGVGGATLVAAFERAGFSDTVRRRPSSRNPIGTFPTVAFPNPEEPGAMDLLLARRPRARRRSRCATIPTPIASVPRSRHPTAAGGDCRATRSVGCWPTTSCATRRATIVWSSPRWCRRRCWRRWQRSTACTSPRPTPASSGSVTPCSSIPNLRFVFGYEQALGYLVCERPLDKDGITAAVLMAEVAALARAEGVTLQGRLDAISAAVRPARDGRLSVKMPPVDGTAAVARVRADPPTDVDGRDGHRGRVVRRGRAAAPATRPRVAPADPPERHRAQGQALRRRHRHRPRPLPHLPRRPPLTRSSVPAHVA